MKKLWIITAAIMSAVFLSGCGQDLKVTVYNASGVNARNGWIVMTSHTERIDRNMSATTYTEDLANLDENNSYTITAKENDTLTVNANGEYATYAADGTITMVEFNTVTADGVITQTLQGGFPDPPQWYAACYINTVIIFRK